MKKVIFSVLFALVMSVAAFAQTTYSKALEEKAILGDAEAMYQLSLCYMHGKGYLKAAEQGDADAQYNLGLCYENGIGIKKDYTQAVYWFKKAAVQEDYEVSFSAKYAVGLCYEEGRGVKKDRSKAIEWYLKATRYDLQQAWDGLERLGYKELV